MTCVVGLITADGRGYMGADSASVDGYDLTIRDEPKVFRNGKFLIGFTTSWRMGQLLRYKLQPPDFPAGMDVEEYMATLFVDAVRQVFKDGGFAQKDKEQESAGQFLVIYRSRLFEVDSDYQVGSPHEGYAAVGSGANVACGAMYATSGELPMKRIQTALEAAELFNAGVRRPFHIERIPVFTAMMSLPLTNDMVEDAATDIVGWT